MSAFLLHELATVTCMHAGTARPITVNPRVTVSGQVTLLLSTVHSISGCTLPPPPGANGPCVTGSWTTAATRVSSGGQPLLLFDSQSICTPSGTPLQVIQTQQRVKGT